jgi:hypothetical protein
LQISNGIQYASGTNGLMLFKGLVNL